MATTISFYNVSAAGFGAFREDLDGPAWADIPGPAGVPLSACESRVMFKETLSIAVNTVIAATTESNRTTLAQARWERCQNRLSHTVAVDEDDESTERQTMARRVRAALLVGNGTGQNGMPADKQVDHGRMQVCQCRQGTQLHRDLEALNYGHLIEDIRTSTEALAEAVGRNATAKQASARSALIRDALGKAATDFLWVDRGHRPHDGNHVGEDPGARAAREAEGEPADAPGSLLRGGAGGGAKPQGLGGECGNVGEHRFAITQPRRVALCRLTSARAARGPSVPRAFRPTSGGKGESRIQVEHTPLRRAKAHLVPATPHLPLADAGNRVPVFDGRAGMEQAGRRVEQHLCDLPVAQVAEMALHVGQAEGLEAE